LDVQTLEQACKELRVAGVFAWNFGFAKGPASQTSGERAVSVILGSSNALAYFEVVLTNASPAGQLYALCGIHKLAPEKFASLAAPLAVTNLTVDVMNGAFLANMDSVSGNVADIAAGKYDKRIEAKPWRWQSNSNSNGGWVLSPRAPLSDQNRSP